MRTGISLAAALLSSLAVVVSPAAADPEQEAAKLASARERWAAHHALDYTYRLRLSCFCLMRDPVTIRVLGGRPQGTPRGLRRFNTVEKLFARVQEEIERGTDELDVRYGSRTGVPRYFAADPVPTAVDDEYAVTVRRVRITRRGG